MATQEVPAGTGDHVMLDDLDPLVPPTDLSPLRRRVAAHLMLPYRVGGEALELPARCRPAEPWWWWALPGGALFAVIALACC